MFWEVIVSSVRCEDFLEIEGLIPFLSNFEISIHYGQSHVKYLNLILLTNYRENYHKQKEVSVNK